MYCILWTDMYKHMSEEDEGIVSFKKKRARIFFQKAPTTFSNGSIVKTVIANIYTLNYFRNELMNIIKLTSLNGEVFCSCKLNSSKNFLLINDGSFNSVKMLINDLGC